MATSPAGRALIESFEGLRTESYQDTGGIWTLGYGHVQGACEGNTCTPEQADAWLAEDLAMTEAGVNAAVAEPINQNQFDSLISLAFNIGLGAFRSSTLLKLLNSGNPALAAQQFVRWDQVNGKPSDGILRRRQAEAALFLTPIICTPEQVSAEEA